jgi:hypothetical protein
MECVPLQDSVSIYDFIETLASSAAVAVDAGRDEVPAATVAAASPDYLELGGKYCEKADQTTRIDLIGCGCRSRFCIKCCCGLGLTLRERLLPVLATFKGLLMWTFTIDPKLFNSPAAAFEYARDNRCISNTMRELRKRGFLHTGRYFVVVEWQMGTGDEPGTLMPHWHLLADSSFIPFETVCQLWNRFRPSSAGPVEGDRPGFGSIRFTETKFVTPDHAANYACKYLIKYPEKGYPDWVLDSDFIHRFSTSRGFWGDSAAPEESPAPDSDECQQTTDGDETDPDNSDVEEQPRTTIRERLAKCGEKTVVMKVGQFIDVNTGEVVEGKERKQFMMRLDASMKTIAECLHITLVGDIKRWKDLPAQALAKLRKYRTLKRT